MSEFSGQAGYLKFLVERQPPASRKEVERALSVLRRMGITNGYEMVRLMAVEINITYGARAELADASPAEPQAEQR